jgi:aspartate 1-decarboxylase
MLRSLCKSKVHRATITEANLHYEGSLTLDKELMEAADLLPYERVHVVNINNGARFDTYIIEGDRGSGTLCLNGAAARLGQVGDLVIVICFAAYTEDEARSHEPRLIMVDEHNRPVGEGGTTS